MHGQTQDKNKPDYDVYVAEDRITVVKNELEDDAIVDSVPVQAIETKEPLRFVLPLYFGAHLAIVLLVLSLALFAKLVPPSAQITVYLTGIPDIAEFKSLPPLSLSQKETVSSTGHKHMPAVSAHGWVYFYNSLTQPQTIQSGTLLIGSDGQQIVTDQAVTVPAGNLVNYGHAAVLAHALAPGAKGNIGAGDISGPCCLAFIQAVSGQFVGGADARDIQTVTKQDILSASTSSLSQLKHSMQERIASLPLSPGEVMRSPVSCSTSTMVNHKVGDIAQTVTVTAHQTCNPQVYNLNDLKHTLISLIAGKTPDEARAILARHGLFSVGIKLSFLQDRIPSDTRKIQLSLLSS